MTEFVKTAELPDQLEMITVVFVASEDCEEQFPRTKYKAPATYVIGSIMQHYAQTIGLRIESLVFSCDSPLDSETPIGQLSNENQVVIEVGIDPSSLIDIEFTCPCCPKRATFEVCKYAEAKTLFNEYASSTDMSLKSFLFSYRGNTLFLSTVGKKTPDELGFQNGDVIEVSFRSQMQGRDIHTVNQNFKRNKSKEKSPKQIKSLSTKGKEKGRTRTTSLCDEDQGKWKIKHSMALSRVLEEADSTLKQIRQKLHSMTLECSQPKKKSKQSPSLLRDIGESLPSFHCEGKAGKSFFVIKVGEVDNLYKTRVNRSSHQCHPSVRKHLKIDLHGLPKKEAIDRLNSNLPQWVEIAMRGSYPWVVTVVVVTGGGSQTLSHAVEDWIRQNKNVANAPKTKNDLK